MRRPPDDLCDSQFVSKLAKHQSTIATQSALGSWIGYQRLERPPDDGHARRDGWQKLGREEGYALTPSPNLILFDLLYMGEGNR